jgi:TRAP-type uncharacterized transport system fused permease subunit
MTNRDVQRVEPDDGAVEVTPDMSALDDAELNEVNVEDYEAESPTRTLAGAWKILVAIIAIGLSLYVLYATRATIPTQKYRVTFLAVALVLTFLLYPARRRGARTFEIPDILLTMAGVVILIYPLVGKNFLLTALLALAVPAAFLILPAWLEDARDGTLPSLVKSIPDLVLVAGAAITSLYPLYDFDNFVYRAARPTETDVWMGAICLLLVIEATRRTIGWILPAVAVLLLAYGKWGYELPGAWGHRGYDVDRMVGTLYISLEGIFGVPLDVAATYIILFTIYGAVLEFSGAGKFFLDFSFAATGRKASGAGRTTTIAGFLLGTVSGSGVATTVTLGSGAWPMLR